MTETYATAQERFWAGEFGTDYSARNQGAAQIEHRRALWAEVLRQAAPLTSLCEFGANIGLNLVALGQLQPAAVRHAIELNPTALAALNALDGVSVHAGTVLERHLTAPVDLTFTVGVLIHIAPERLTTVYDHLHAGSRRYIAVAEYYNPTPVEVPYRGHDARLFKRDFAGEMLDRFSDLRLVDYGFRYHRDPAHPADDLTWFLMEKR